MSDKKPVQKRPIPDVTAFTLEQARHVLAEQDLFYVLTETFPARPRRLKDIQAAQGPPSYRIIRQTERRDGTIELIIAQYFPLLPDTNQHP